VAVACRAVQQKRLQSRDTMSADLSSGDSAAVPPSTADAVDEIAVLRAKLATAERDLCEERKDVAGLVKQLATAAAAPNVATQSEAERTLEKTCAAIVAVSKKSSRYADVFIEAGGYGVVEQFLLQSGLRETAATAAVLDMLSEVTRGIGIHGFDLKAGFRHTYGGAAASVTAALLGAASTRGWAVDGDFTGTRGNCARQAVYACCTLMHRWPPARAVPGLAAWCAQTLSQCFSTSSGIVFNEYAAWTALKCMQNSMWCEHGQGDATTEANARTYEERGTFQVVEAIMRDARISRNILATAVSALMNAEYHGGSCKHWVKSGFARKLYKTLGDATIQSVQGASRLQSRIGEHLLNEAVQPVPKGATVKTGANSVQAEAAQAGTHSVQAKAAQTGAKSVQAEAAQTGANSVQAEAVKAAVEEADGVKADGIAQCSENKTVCANQQPPACVEDAGLDRQFADVHRHIADLCQRLGAVEAVCFDLGKCHRDPIVHVATAPTLDTQADANVPAAATTQDNGAEAPTGRACTEARTAEPDDNGTKTGTPGAGKEPSVPEIGTRVSVGLGTVTPVMDLVAGDTGLEHDVTPATDLVAGDTGLEHDVRAVIALVAAEVGSLRAQLAFYKNLEAYAQGKNVTLRAQLAVAKNLEATLLAENATLRLALGK
jgi:hypothetical protein